MSARLVRWAVATSRSGPRRGDAAAAAGGELDVAAGEFVALLEDGDGGVEVERAAEVGRWP